MPFVEASSDGVTNSTTVVVVVAAPAASTRRIVKTITVWNADTATAIIRLQFVNGANTRVFDRQSLATLVPYVWDDPLILDSTSESIKIVLEGAVTTNQLDWTSHFADVT